MHILIDADSFWRGQAQVDKPKSAPARMLDKIWNPQVKKIDTERLMEL